ncbi:hypothetical protein P692DRAFT_201792032, partial [Suillus brevipes Sb2]
MEKQSARSMAQKWPAQRQLQLRNMRMAIKLAVLRKQVNHSPCRAHKCLKGDRQQT